MSMSVARAGRQREDNTGDLALVGSVQRSQQAVTGNQQAVNDGDGAWFPRLVGQCVDAHVSHKVAALTMGIDKGQLTRQFDGDGHLSAKRAGLLPQSVWLDIAEGIKAHFGMSDPRAEKRQAAEDAMRAIGRLAALAVGE
jgi:hypothetical protein